MLGLIFGPFTLILGLKGFSEAGMPFTKTRKITGKPAKIIGTLCVCSGALMSAGGIFSLLNFIGRLVQLSGS